MCIKSIFKHLLPEHYEDFLYLRIPFQGTADIVLDSCVEYWNGQDLSVLSPSDRKKVLDFYQRSSLTAYCSAFSYR